VWCHKWRGDVSEWLSFSVPVGEGGARGGGRAGEMSGNTRETAGRSEE